MNIDLSEVLRLVTAIVVPIGVAVIAYYQRKIHAIVNHEHDEMVRVMKGLSDEIASLKNDKSTLTERVQGLRIAQALATSMADGGVTEAEAVQIAKHEIEAAKT